MDLIALLGADADLQATLASVTDSSFHFQPSAANSTPESVLRALEPLNFAGAAVLDPELQKAIFSQVERPSVNAQKAGAVDTVIVTAAGLVGEYTLGQALGELLLSSSWNVRGARGVVVGGGAEANACARELASLGLNHLSVLGKSKAAAEQVSAGLAATTQTLGAALKSPIAATYIEQADILLRCDAAADIPSQLLGPHLSVIDLSPTSLSALRESALKVGAKTLGARDVWAYQMMLITRQILGRRLEPAPFLELFHTQVS